MEFAPFVKGKGECYGAIFTLGFVYCTLAFLIFITQIGRIFDGLTSGCVSSLAVLCLAYLLFVPRGA